MRNNCNHHCFTNEEVGMSSYLFDRDIETEKYKWEQNTVSWSSIAEDEEGF
jgi:hypothetical protein